MKKYLLNILLFLLCPSLVAMAQAPKIQETVNEQKEWFVDYFATHILECEKKDNNMIKLKSDGFIVNKEGVADFELMVGEEFAGDADHHATKSYVFKSVDEAGVVIGYESKFDHSSFGQDLITIDTGEVVVQCAN